MKDTKEIWVKTGYEWFALYGQTGLKVEPIARAVGKSKSSFYHHFADLEIFMEALLKHHLEKAEVIACKEKQAALVDPDLIRILVDHSVDLLFSRQLRIHQNVPEFASVLEQSNRIVGNAVVKIWVKDLSLPLTESQAEGLFGLALENFYLQINPGNLNTTWLSAYFAHLKETTKKIVGSFVVR